MKGSCALVTSVLAASVVAVSSSSGDREVRFATSSEQKCLHSPATCSTSSPLNGKERSGKPVGEKFVPRFDGLRFIETLVTAHR